jgi:hypothetical protein
MDPEINFALVICILRASQKQLLFNCFWVGRLEKFKHTSVCLNIQQGNFFASGFFRHQFSAIFFRETGARQKKSAKKQGRASCCY